MAEKSMRLITTYWGDRKTFKLMPIDNNCPYMEVIYDINTDLLAVLSKASKENLQLVPKLDDDGNQVAVKKPKQNGKPWKEKHLLMTVPQEFYLTERDEQKEFIDAFAVNADSYDYNKYFEEHDQAANAIQVPESQPLVDSNGVPLKVEN